MLAPRCHLPGPVAQPTIRPLIYPTYPPRPQVIKIDKLAYIFRPITGVQLDPARGTLGSDPLRTALKQGLGLWPQVPLQLLYGV